MKNIEIPGQGKRRDQYETTAKIIVMTVIGFAIIVFGGLIINYFL